MAPADVLRLALETIAARRARAGLAMLGVAIGIAAVVLLASIGEGTRVSIAAQFSQFGTNLIGVAPGREATFGAGAALMGSTRPLTIEDADALRRVAGVRHVAPHVLGAAEIDAGERARNTYVYGTVADDEHCLAWRPRVGSFIPEGDPDAIPAVCVLGARVAEELYGTANPLGARLRIGGTRFTVVGVMSRKGQMIGFDFDDMAFIPVRRALRLFNREGVNEIHVMAASHERIEPVMAGIREVLADRHDGEEDFTLTSNADMLATIGEVLGVLEAGVLGIGAISLLVGSIGILTVMWMATHERTEEVGLMKAIGASERQVLTLFLAEAALVSLGGGVAGLIGAAGLGRLVHALVPGIAIAVPLWAIPAALGVSLLVGLAAGVAPARRAARLDPVEALRAE